MLGHPSPPDRLHPTQRAGDVDVEDLADGGQVGLHQRAVLRVDAGVVDQYVDRPEPLSGLGDRIRLVIDIVGAAAHAERPVRPAQPFHRRGQLVGLARGQTNPGAARGQLRRDPEPDPPGAAGHQRHPTVEAARHGDLLSMKKCESAGQLVPIPATTADTWFTVAWCAFAGTTTPMTAPVTTMPVTTIPVTTTPMTAPMTTMPVTTMPVTSRRSS